MPPLAPGHQTIHIRQHHRIVTCEEARCDWFLHGHQGMDEGEPFTHPAGVACGDFARCTHPNCPCPQRVPHQIPDESRNLDYFVNRGQGARPVVEDEALTRLAEGVESTRHILLRGL